MQTILILIVTITALNFILIWDQMNRTRRLAELMLKLVDKLAHDHHTIEP